MKKLVSTQIYRYTTKNEITVGDILNGSDNPTDVVHIYHPEDDPENYGDDYTEHTILSIHRMIEETDEEYNARLKSDAHWNEERRKTRYENYLKLKKEFENE